MTPLKKEIGWLLGLLICLQFNNLLGGKIDSPINGLNHKLFASDIYSVLTEGQSAKNTIFSPFSIQTALAMAYVGADGQTAEDMRTVLRLGSGSRTENVEEFGKLLAESVNSDKPNAPQLKIADRIYVNEYYELQPEFNKLTKEHFKAVAESIKFENGKLAADKINSFIESATENRIKEIVRKEELSADTTAILVNSLYFKGQWKHPFDVKRTQDSDFYVTREYKKLVKMMHYTGHFRFADLPELDATALELPYNNSDISMLIILPNDLEGLEKLETKLKDVDLSEISSKTTLGKACVDMPRFRLENEIDMKEPLTKLGLPVIFSDQADFGKLYTSPEKLSMSYVRHKAFLDVNEFGSEATASIIEAPAECYNLVPRFQANHPFMFAIRSDKVIYFTGHVSNP